MENVKMIEHCISCPIAHQVISDYLRFYPLYLKYNKADKTEKSEKLNAISDIVNKISYTLKIKGDIEKRCEYLGNLCSITMKEKNSKLDVNTTDTPDCCLQSLNEIIVPLKILFEKDNNYRDKSDIYGLYLKGGEQIILLINSYLKRNNIIVSEKNEEFIKNIKKYNKVVKTLKDEDSVKIKGLYINFYKIIDTYCSTPNENLKFEYCSSAYDEYKMLRDCQSEKFLEYITSLKSPLDHKRIYNLKDEYFNIIENYIIKAHKSFGYNFSRIMEIQGLTENDISKLFCDTNKISKIQKLCESKEPTLQKADIKLLTRILLVSEDVLYCGTGKIYGNWKLALEQGKNKDFQDNYHTSKSKDTKEAIRKQIIEFINLEDENFEDMIRDNEFFYEENICLFTYEEDGEEYYDYDLMYENLLHPEDFDTLLSVLEELQSKENN